MEKKSFSLIMTTKICVCYVFSTELKRIKEQDANKLIQLTEQTHLTAAKMSSAIKKRDLERVYDASMTT